MMPYPEDWKVMRLGDKADICRGGSPRPIQDWLTTADDGVNWIKIGDVAPGARYIVKTEEKIRPEGVQFSRVVHKGELILSNSMSFGRPYILKIDGCIHDGWLSIQHYEGAFDTEYLCYALSSEAVLAQYIAMAAGSSVKNLNKDKVRDVALPHPILSEQKRIAAVLSTADKLIANVEKRIAKQRAIKQGAMQELLTGKKRLPGFVGNWKNIRLGDIADIRTGKKNGDEQKPDGKYPFFVRSQEVYRINTYSYDGEAILIPGEGGIGSIFHYINGRFDYHQRVYKISDMPDNICVKYVYYFMSRYFGPYALKNTVKATVDSLRLPTFQNFIIELPECVSEQKAIAKVLGNMDSEIANLERKLGKLKLLKQGMMQDLLTGKVRLRG